MASKPSGLRKPASGIKPPATPAASTNPASASSTTSIPGAMSRIPSSSSMKRRQGGPSGEVSGSEIGSQVSKDSGLAGESEHFVVGDIVFVNGDADKRGKICYIGDVAFASGEFAGIALDLPAGKHDGQVKGHRYFQCAENHGVFTKLNRIFREPLRSPQMSEIDGPATRIGSTPIRFHSPGIAPSLSQTLMSPPERTPSPFGSKTTTPGGLQIGERVIVSSATGGTKMGILRYLGPTDFAAGQWCGIELDKGHPGKNDGSVGGKRYFSCEDGRGLFVPVSKVMASPMNRGSLRRHGSRESLASISSLASSVASRSTKRVSSQRHQCLPTCSMLAVLKEKENHVEHLLKERELDRMEMVNVARKLDECSQEFRSTKETLEKSKAESAAEIEKLQLALDEEKRKYEDLQYSLDEERVSKSELTAQLESLAQRAVNDKSNVSEIDRLSANALESDNSIKDLKDALTEKSKALEGSEAAIASLRSDNETLKISFAKAQQDLQEKDLVIEESKGRIQQVDTFAKEKENSESKLLATVEELRSQQSDLKAQMSKYEEKIKQLEQKKIELQSEIKEIVSSQDTSSETLAQKLESSNSELGVLKSRVDVLSKEITDHKSTISTMEANEKTLSAELDSQNSAKSALEASLAEKVKELTSAQEKYKREITELQKASEAKVNSLTEQLNHGNLQSSEAHGALEEIRLQKEKLLSDNLVLGTAKTDLEEELKKLRSEIEVLRNNNASLETQLLDHKKTHSADYHKLLQTYKDSVAQCNDLKSKVASLETDVESKASLHNAAVTEIAVKETEIQNLQKTIDELKARCEGLEENVRARSADLVSLENHIKGVEADFLNLQEEKQRRDLVVKNYEVNMRAMIQRAENAEQVGRELKASYESTMGKLADTEKEITELKKVYEESNKSILILDEEKRATGAKLSQLELDVRNKTTELEQNRCDASKIAEDLQQVKKELHSRDQLISSLEEEIKNARKETASCSANLQEKVKKLAEYEKKLEAQTSESSKMISEFRVKDETVGELEQSIAQLKMQIAYLEKNIDEKNKTIRDFQSKLDSVANKPSEVIDKDSEINFLNSIIVDLQHKNHELNTKVDVLMHGSSPVATPKSAPVQASLRLYCDICEKFDVHDTEDCPTQASEVPQGHQGPKPAKDRPYCDSCESFGHNTEDCDDGETF